MSQNPFFGSALSLPCMYSKPIRFFGCFLLSIYGYLFYEKNGGKPGFGQFTLGFFVDFQHISIENDPFPENSMVFPLK